MFGLANQQYGIYIPDTELELIMIQTFPLGGLVWHLSTQVDDGDLAAYITVFDLRRDKCKCLIPFLVYALVYPIISSNRVTLPPLSLWSDSICTHTCFPFLMDVVTGGTASTWN